MTARIACVARLIEEIEITRDACLELYAADGTLMEWRYTPVPPSGTGWRIKDDSRDYKTEWHRFIAVLPKGGAK